MDNRMPRQRSSFVPEQMRSTPIVSALKSSRRSPIVSALKSSRRSQHQDQDGSDENTPSTSNSARRNIFTKSFRAPKRRQHTPQMTPKPLQQGPHTPAKKSTPGPGRDGNAACISDAPSIMMVKMNMNPKQAQQLRAWFKADGTLIGELPDPRTWQTTMEKYPYARGHLSFLRLLQANNLAIKPLANGSFFIEGSSECDFGLGVRQELLEEEAGAEPKLKVRRIKKIQRADGSESYFDGWEPFCAEKDRGYIFTAATKLILLSSILEKIKARWKKKEDCEVIQFDVDGGGDEEPLTWKKLLAKLNIEEPLPFHDQASRESVDRHWFFCPVRIICTRTRKLELKQYPEVSGGKSNAMKQCWISRSDDAADVERWLRREILISNRAQRTADGKILPIGADGNKSFWLVDGEGGRVPGETRVDALYAMAKEENLYYMEQVEPPRGHPPVVRWSSESQKCGCWEMQFLQLCLFPFALLFSPHVWRLVCCCISCGAGKKEGRDEKEEEDARFEEEKLRELAISEEEDARYARSRPCIGGSSSSVRKRESECMRRSCWSLRFLPGGPPLDAIEQQHGTSMAMFFAWEQFYARWLIIPALIGLVVFAMQLRYRSVDQPLLSFFALFINVWLCTLPVAWKARETELALRWGVFNYERTEERILNDFDGEISQERVTGVEEMKARRPQRDRLYRCISWSGIIGVTCVCLLFTLGLPLLRDVGWPEDLCATLLVPSENSGGEVTTDASSSDSDVDLESPLSMVETEEGLLGQLQLLLSGRTLTDAERLRAWGYALWYIAVPFVLFSLAIPTIDWLVEHCSRNCIAKGENHKTETKARAHRIYKVFFFRFANGVFPLLVESFGARMIQLYGVGAHLVSGSQQQQQQEDALLALWLQLLSFMLGQLVMNTIFRWQISSWLKPLGAAPLLKCKCRSARSSRSANSAAGAGEKGDAVHLPKSRLYFSCSESFRRDVRSTFCLCESTTKAKVDNEFEMQVPKFRAEAGLSPLAADVVSFAAAQPASSSSSSAGEPSAASQWALDVFDDFASFCESMMQLGYVTFFSPVFPLAPVLALISNVMGLRLKGHRLLYLQRRAAPRRASGIGVWNDCIAYISKIAIIVNCMHVVLTSSTMEGWGISREATMWIALFSLAVGLLAFHEVQSRWDATPGFVKRRLREIKAVREWEIKRK